MQTTAVPAPRSPLPAVPAGALPCSTACALRGAPPRGTRHRGGDSRPPASPAPRGRDGRPRVAGQRDFTCSRPAVTNCRRCRAPTERGGTGAYAFGRGNGLDWGRRCPPVRDTGVARSSLRAAKASFEGHHRTASASQEASLSFIYYLFYLVAAPTSANCYKKRMKAGLVTLPEGNAATHRVPGGGAGIALLRPAALPACTG